MLKKSAGRSLDILSELNTSSRNFPSKLGKMSELAQFLRTSTEPSRPYTSHSQNCNESPTRPIADVDRKVFQASSTIPHCHVKINLQPHPHLLYTPHHLLFFPLLYILAQKIVNNCTINVIHCTIDLHYLHSIIYRSS